MKSESKCPSCEPTMDETIRVCPVCVHNENLTIESVGKFQEAVWWCEGCDEAVMPIAIGDYDPTPWCHKCGARDPAKCDCGSYADNA